VTITPVKLGNSATLEMQFMCVSGGKLFLGVPADTSTRSAILMDRVIVERDSLFVSTRAARSVRLAYI
jgi:hypothetical protein